jgi:hypothetical protein
MGQNSAWAHLSAGGRLATGGAEHLGLGGRRTPNRVAAWLGLGRTPQRVKVGWRWSSVGAWGGAGARQMTEAWTAEMLNRRQQIGDNAQGYGLFF